MTKNKILVVLILLAILSFVQVSSAAVYSINGTVNRTDNNTRIVGATIFNGSNTTISNADGAWGLSAMQNDTGRTGWQITYRVAGFTQQINYTNVSAANNITNNISLTPITPTQSNIVDSASGRTAAIVSWTVTATDNINNNFVANRVRYSKDSGIANNVFTTAFSNNTASPSFTITGLEVGSTYYYHADTFNIANGAYSVISAVGSFTTQRGNATDDEELYQQTSYIIPEEESSPLASILPIESSGSGISKNTVIVVAAIIVIVLVMSGNGGKKGRRR